MPKNLNMKKPRDRKQSFALNEIFSEIKDLSILKSEAIAHTLSLAEKELKKVAKQIEIRENYFVTNQISPDTAIDFIEKRQIALDVQQKRSYENTASSQAKRRTLKGKKGIDVTS
jgi:hypothetical protein